MNVEENLKDALRESVRLNTNELNSREFKALHQEIKDLKEAHEQKIAVLQKAIDTQRAERDKFLIWGLLTLGSAVVAMAGWFATSIKWVIKLTCKNHSIALLV